MPHVDDCRRYPACMFTSDYCDACMGVLLPEGSAARRSQVLELEKNDMQTTGTMPQIHSNANYGKGKSGSAKTTKGGKGKKY